MSKTEKNADNDEDWDLIIRPKSGLLNIDLKEVWRYRDLMVLFVKRDFIAQYKQTILGPLWHVIQPILTTVMFLLIFSRIARIPTDGIHPVAFYMAGITIWNYFSICLLATSNTFVANAGIFGKVYFPRLITPISIVLSNLVKLGIQFGLLIAVLIWFHFNGFPLNVSYLWGMIPILVFVLAGISLGLGIIISSVTTKYRDFAVLLSFAVQLGMYATPIAYPMSYLVNKSYGWIIKLNPLTPVVEAFRYCLFGKGTFVFSDLIYSFGFMTVVLVVGILMFNRVQKSFMDTV